VASTLRIYDKPGRLQQILTRTPPELLKYAVLVRKNFETYVQSGSGPAPPRGGGASS
jgi:hypothetical protein